MASSTMTPALPSDVPEEDSSRSTYSWYCDAAYSASSPASSRRARRAVVRNSGSSSGSGDAMSVTSGVASTGCPSTASFSALPQLLPACMYRALPCKMPQTDRLARWRCAPDNLPLYIFTICTLMRIRIDTSEAVDMDIASEGSARCSRLLTCCLRRQYQQAWERDPFLTAGGDCKVSKRPRENFGEYFAQEHMLLAMEREAYIKGRGTAFISEDGADEEEAYV